MGDKKTEYYPTPIFEMTDGTKYALNPYAEQPGDSETRINDQLSLRCSQCNQSFTDSSEFTKHNTDVHTKKEFSCNICDGTFTRLDHLKRHIMSVHNSLKTYTCPVCQLDCKQKGSLLKHIKKKHSNTKEVFRCHECEFEGTTMQELEKHSLVIHLLTDRHSCPHCESTFKRRDHMLRHVKSQHLNQVEPCPLCPQRYKRKDHVVRHLREKHRTGLVNGQLVSIDVAQVDVLSTGVS